MNEAGTSMINNAYAEPIRGRRRADGVAESARVHQSAEVEDGALVGVDTTVWGLAHLRAGAVVGAGCTIGRGVFIDEDVVLGDRVKVQNHALLYRPARIGNGVFIGPAVVLTNDLYPRAVTVDGTSKTGADWQAAGVTLRSGCSIGARSVLLPGVTVGCWAMVAAGSVVTEDVLDYALVAGVPARHRAWVGRAGRPLEVTEENRYRCPLDGTEYVVGPNGLQPLDRT